MLSLSAIQNLSDEAAQRAAEENREPYVFWDKDEVDRSVRSIPNLGSHVPKGWSEFGDALFVDKSGMGADNEPALSLDQFKQEVKSIIDSHERDIGFAIVEEGQFQIYIQPFTRLIKK
jgi:hypothetical protein